MNIETFRHLYGKEETHRVLEAAGLKPSYLYSLEKRLRVPRPITAQRLVDASEGRLTLESLLLVERVNPKREKKAEWNEPEVTVGQQLADAFIAEATENVESA